MIATQAIIIQCYCDSCGAGMLQPLLQAGSMEKKNIHDMKGQSFPCPECKTENILAETYTLLPESFLIVAGDDLSKMKQDVGMKMFLDDEQYPEK